MFDEYPSSPPRTPSPDCEPAYRNDSSSSVFFDFLGDHNGVELEDHVTMPVKSMSLAINPDASSSPPGENRAQEADDSMSPENSPVFESVRESSSQSSMPSDNCDDDDDYSTPQPQKKRKRNGKAKTKQDPVIKQEDDQVAKGYNYLGDSGEPCLERNAPPSAPTNGRRSKRWTPWDDYVITVLKEGYDYGWKRISSYIKNRHSWQGIQMHYLRSLKKRNYPLDSDEEEKLRQCIEKDWNNRFQRLAHEMGTEYTPRRLVRAAIKMTGNGSLLDNGGRHYKDLSSVYPLPESEQNLEIVQDPGVLGERAVRFMHDNQVHSTDELIEVYLCPTK